MVIHRLKTWPEYFAPSRDGMKPFEIRKNDRDFKVADLLILEEYDPKKGEYTGKHLIKIVTYVTDFEQKPGYVVMGVRQASFEVA